MTGSTRLPVSGSALARHRGPDRRLGELHVHEARPAPSVTFTDGEGALTNAVPAHLRPLEPAARGRQPVDRRGDRRLVADARLPDAGRHDERLARLVRPRRAAASRASLILPDVTATVSNLSVLGERGERQDANAQAPRRSLEHDLEPALDPSSRSRSRAAQLSAQGDLTNLSIFGILTGSAHVSFAQQTVAVQLGSSVLTGATLVSFSLSLASGDTLTAGVSGFGLDDHERARCSSPRSRRRSDCSPLDRRRGNRPCSDARPSPA